MSDTTISSTTDADVVVVGAGLAGLATAAYVARAGHTVLVLERQRRLGGRAGTDVRNGFRFNQGPHALYRGGPAETVLRELGVAVRGGRPPVRGKVIFGDRLHAAPADARTLLTTSALSLRDRIEAGRVLARLPSVDAASLAHRTVDGWIDDLVVRARPRQLLHALVRLATYTNEPSVLSAEVAVQQMQTALSRGVLYLHGGWQTLVDQLAITPGVHTVGRETITDLPDAPVVVVATGGPAAARALVGRQFDVGPPAAAGCLDLGLNRAPGHDFVLGGDEPFYFSNHSAAARLAPDGRWHAAAVQYLASDGHPDANAIRRHALRSGVDEGSIVEERYLRRMTTVTAIATADGGGLSGRPRVDAPEAPNVFLAGDWVGPTGHLADATLASARDAARAAVQHLDRRPVLR